MFETLKSIWLSVFYPEIIKDTEVRHSFASGVMLIFVESCLLNDVGKYMP